MGQTQSSPGMSNMSCDWIQPVEPYDPATGHWIDSTCLLQPSVLHVAQALPPGATCTLSPKAGTCCTQHRGLSQSVCSMQHLTRPGASAQGQSLGRPMEHTSHASPTPCILKASCSTSYAHGSRLGTGYMLPAARGPEPVLHEAHESMA